LPIGQNGPVRPPMGLFSELITGTAFAAPRHRNQSTYVFRVQPSVIHGSYSPWSGSGIQTPPLEIAPYPGPLRWHPLPDEALDKDFVEGIETICANGSPRTRSGIAIHVYRANRSMHQRAF